MDEIPNYFNEGSSLEKLRNTIGALDDVSEICSKSDQDVTASDLYSILQLVLLRFQQVYQELEADTQRGKQ